MIINSISFKNFLSYSNKLTVFEFSKSEKILISGKNGSGKTTLLEAIFFNLTGNSFRGAKLDQLVNSKNKKDLLTVGEYVSHTETKLKIVRGRKPNIFELFINDVKQDEQYSKDFQARIEQILEFDSKNLDKTFIISSTSYKPFLSLSPADKRKLIDQIIEIESFSRMQDSMKKDRTIEKEKLKDFEAEISKLKSNIEIIEEFNRSINETKPDESEIEEYQNQLEEIKEKAKKIKKEKDNVQGKIDDLTKSSNDLIQLDLKQQKAINDLEIKSYEIKAKHKTKRDQYVSESLYYLDNDFCDRCKREINEEEKQKITWVIEQKILELNSETNDSLDKKIELYRKKNNELKITIDSNQKMINFMVESLSKLTENQHKLKYEYQHIDEKKKSLETSISNGLKQKDFSDLLSQLNKNYEGRIETQKKLDVIETSIKLLGEKYLRSFMINKYLPVLNTNLNGYLEIFGLKFRVVLDGEFNEKLLSREYENLSYQNLSEGEKLRVNMSLLFAFFDITKLRHKINSNILLMDEILDMSGDFEFLNGMNHIINLLTEDELSCIIVSHNSDLQNIIDFDRHLKLSKINGFTNIEED